MHPSRTPISLAMAAALLSFGVSHGIAAQEEREHSENRARVQVFGEVVDHRSGDPVRGSRVALAPLPSRTPRLGPSATDGAGRFAFDDVLPGWYLLTATAPDYRALTDSVEVPATEDLQLLIPLSTGPVSLAARVVSARPPRASPAFDARRRSGRGFILTREEIEASNAPYLTDLLLDVPGARVVYTPPSGNTLLLRGNCRPGVWLDGLLMRDAPPLDLVVSLHSVAAVEVYHGFDLPTEFGVDTCGGVLIWTRIGSDHPAEPGDASTAETIRRSAVAVGLVLLMMFAVR